MLNLNKDIAITPVDEFAKQATDEKIARTSKALEANGIQTLIAENGAEAKRLFFELIPKARKFFSERL